jgi:hypothetical protein
MFIPDPNFFHPGSQDPDPHPHQRIFSILAQKIVSKLSEIWSKIPIHLVSGSWFFTHPGSRCQKSTGSRIRIHNTVGAGTNDNGIYPVLKKYLEAVLRIPDILVWIRIRGPMPLTNGSGFGSGCGSFYFHHWPSRCQPKNNFFLTKFFCIILFDGTFTSFFKGKKSKKSHKK